MAKLDYLADLCLRAEANPDLKGKWYLPTAAALAACSAGSDIPALHQLLTADASLEEKKLIQRRLKEAILKTSCLYGVPRSLGALFPLFEIIPDENIDTFAPRWSSLNDESEGSQRKERAKNYFDTLWGASAAQGMRDKLFKYQPDLYLLNLETIYEMWISEDRILDPIETQMCNISAIICSNAPLQALWHTKGLIKHGGSKEQAAFVQELALAIARANNCSTGEITPVEQIDFQD